MTKPALAILMTPGSAKQFFKAIASAVGKTQLVSALPVSWRSFPETPATARLVRETYTSSARPKVYSNLLPEGLALRLLELRYNGLRRWFAENPGMIALAWNGMDRKRRLFHEAAKAAGNPLLFAELAPLPGFLALDPKGINYNNSLPRDASFYLDWAKTAGEGPDWKAIKSTLTARKPRKRKAAAPAHPQPVPDGPFLFVPLQVPGDSQLRYFGGFIPTVEAMLEALKIAAAHLPEGWHIRIKEHPSARVDLSGHIRALADHRCYLDNDADTFAQVEASGGVITVNSSVGLQSFLFDRPVIVLGQASYGFEPLVHLAQSQQAFNDVLAQADRLQVDDQLRAAYMRYLQEVYLLPASLRQAPYLLGDAAERVKAVVARLQIGGNP